MSVKFIGADDLIKHLGSKDGVGKDLERVVKENTAKLQGESQRGAPVSTGYMKSKITQSIKDGGMTGQVSSEAPYSTHVEFGTFKQAAQPFMRPALNYISPKFKADIERVVKK